MTMKSSRNKTIDISLSEGQQYLNRCVFQKSAQNIGDITDKIICGDTMSTAALLPHGFADLVIADPPYNLDKDFHGEKFKRMSAQQYAIYTREWINAVLPLMSENASIYVCCDWESSLIIGNVLSEFFTVRNRITCSVKQAEALSATGKTAWRIYGLRRAQTIIALMRTL